MKYIFSLGLFILCNQIFSQSWSKTFPLQLTGDRSGVVSQSLDLSDISVPDFIGISFYVEGKNINPDNIEVTITTNSRNRNVLPFAEDHHQEDRFVSELLYLDPKEAGICKLDFSFQGNVNPKELKGAIRVFVPHMSPSTNENKISISSARQMMCPCPQPDYVPRTSWGAEFGLNGNIYIGPPVYTVVTHLIVHHSAGTNVSNNWAGVVAAIFDFHVNTNKWSDVGYNWLIDPNGVIYEGRGGGDNVRGAHMCGYNNNSMATCLLGNFEVAQPTEAMLASLTKLLSWKACKENITPDGSSNIVSHTGFMQHISGHKDGCSPNYTQCPGQNLYDKLPTIRTGTKYHITEVCSSISNDREASIDDRVHVMPNPAGDVISIVVPDHLTDFQGVAMYNLSGKRLWQTTLHQNRIDVSHLPSGTYFIELSSYNARTWTRFFKL